MVPNKISFIQDFYYQNKNPFFMHKFDNTSNIKALKILKIN